ncbi:hypothetical protein B0H17DRAFT_1201609 [Mycena rosella]|uniref:Uncharacterized protein n=1 Tax=Mycena rosella TaxID=1033263 RepID=A0AAD7DFY6_MYCRO|nr:hypothetical protein B0H17DRAFT_1201609 [Mycena rosella]
MPIFIYIDTNVSVDRSSTENGRGTLHAVLPLHLHRNLAGLASGIFLVCSPSVRPSQTPRAHLDEPVFISQVDGSHTAASRGLFPPSPKNKITRANETVVVAPLGGYQYVAMETVEPGNDRSMESWTDCPAFQKHVASFHGSDAFETKAEEASSFLKNVQDYVFGCPTTLENIWNIHDFINTQLTYNQTYAYRLPPSYLDRARRVFSDAEANGIGNIAGRTMLHTILTSLERIASNENPLQLMAVQTSYQPFISLFHQTDIVKDPIPS